MNNVNLIGRLTADPELRTTGSGISTTRFSIAIDGVPTPSGERHTDFINIVAWRNQADNVCKFCHKGSLVGVTGRIQTSSYKDKNGNKIFKTDVLANTIIFLDHKNSETTENVIQTESKSVENDVAIDDADLPF